jgi:hypothetical protein
MSQDVRPGPALDEDGTVSETGSFGGANGSPERKEMESSFHHLPPKVIEQ